MSDPTTLNYSLRAVRFSEWAEEPSMADAAAKLRARFLAHCLRGGRHSLILFDLGCGSGRDAFAFAREGHVVFGVEPCAEFVHIARAKPVNVVQAGFEDLAAVLSQHAGSADGIWCLASLFHVPRGLLPNVLQSLYALLRAGGVLMTTIPCTETSDARGADGRWITAMPLGDQLTLLASVGFECIESDANLRIYNGQWGTCFARRPAELSMEEKTRFL
jgi:SAM-dependent methyltransferase